MTEVSDAPQAPPVPDVYAIFCGPIDQVSAQRLVNFLSIGMAGKVRPHVHMLFQSAGGFVGDGVFLYNLFRSLPLELTLYNVGQISSAGVTAYLGARRRKTSAQASFMIHQSSNSPMAAGAARLQNIAKSLVLDDERTESILRTHVTMPDALWQEMRFHNVFVSGADAVTFGMADEVSEFSPPAGSQVFNVLS